MKKGSGWTTRHSTGANQWVESDWGPATPTKTQLFDRLGNPLERDGSLATLDENAKARLRLKQEQKERPKQPGRHKELTDTMHFHLSRLSSSYPNQHQQSTMIPVLEDLHEMKSQIQSDPLFRQAHIEAIRSGAMNDLIAVNERFQQQARELNDFVRRYDRLGQKQK